MKAWTPDQVGGDKFGVGGDSFAVVLTGSVSCWQVRIGTLRFSHHRVTSDLDAFEVAQSGTLGAAYVGGLRATGVEGAAARRVERVGHFILHRGAGAAGVVHLRNHVQWAQCINAVR